MSSENYYRRPRIITLIAKGGIRRGGTNSGVSIGGTSGKRDCHCASSQSLNVSMDVAVTISSGSLFHYGTHVDGDGSYTAVSESSKYDPEAQCGWGQQRPRHIENLRRPCIILYMQILLRTRENSCSRWRAVSYGTWRNPFTNCTASF